MERVKWSEKIIIDVFVSDEILCFGYVSALSSQKQN